MKRIMTRLISILLVAVMCISMLPIEVFAWGKMTHVYTANLIQRELTNGNDSIAVPYDGNSAFEYEIPDEYYEAIMEYPEAFRAGALGPDVYPDIITGQMYLHPEDEKIDSGAWVAYLCNSVNKMGKDTEGRKICLAFTLGCILHYCGDLFGHDFVNTFSGGAFPSILSPDIVNIKGERLNNILSHLSTEKYMDSLLYPSYSSQKDGNIDAPDEFVANAMIFDGTPAAGLVPLYKQYPASINDLLGNLKDATEDIVLVGDIVENIVEDFFDEDSNNVPPHYTAMLALRNYVTSTADEHREHMEFTSACVTAYCDAWAEDIDEAMAAFTEASDNVARRMVTKDKKPEIEKIKEDEKLEDINGIYVEIYKCWRQNKLDEDVSEEQ